MKLWKKISIICSIVLVVIVATCSTLLLLQSKNSILEITYQQARDKQRNLVSSFSHMASYYANENDHPVASESLIRYCFTRFADSSSVLLSGSDELYSELKIGPDEYLSLSNDREQQQFAGEIEGRNMLIVGSSVTIKQNNYSVYVVEDISTVYNDIADMIWRFTIISIVCIVVGVAIISLLVRHSMQSLTSLSKTAKRIAAGDYAERATVIEHNEVGTLAEDLNAMAAAVESHVEKLTETVERQRLFIGGVTHEFKTPLTTIILNADTLQNTYIDEEEMEMSVAYIRRQCEWLERMTQKLLKLITLKQDIKLKPTSVPQLFIGVEQSVAETLRQRGISLMSDCKIDTLSMDADLMQSVLINLIDNASKASAPGQIVTMRAYGNVIEVSDNGIGIPESEVARITEPFYVVDKSRSKKRGGMGIGLALVKEIVTAHGTDLNMESKVGNGTTVRIQFTSSQYHEA